jgi:hypothetical protein
MVFRGSGAADGLTLDGTSVQVHAFHQIFMFIALVKYGNAYNSFPPAACWSRATVCLCMLTDSRVMVCGMQRYVS